MDKKFDDLCDGLDAAVFTGEWLRSPGNLAGFKDYLARWTRAVEDLEPVEMEGKA